MGEIKDQVNQAIAGASMFGREDITGPQFLDPESPGYGKPQVLNVNDEMTALRDAIGGLITAVRILADHLDAH
jgi:hypothetical protein